MGRNSNDQSSVGDQPDGDVVGLQVLDTATEQKLDSLDQAVLDRPQNTETGSGSGDFASGR